MIDDQNGRTQVKKNAAQTEHASLSKTPINLEKNKRKRNQNT